MQMINSSSKKASNMTQDESSDSSDPGEENDKVMHMMDDYNTFR